MRPAKFEVVIHGYGGYTAGCSCAVCRAAKAKRERDRRAASKAVNAPTAPTRVATAQPSKSWAAEWLGDLEWQAKSACLESEAEMFFDEESTAAAKERCAVCPVVPECLRWADQIGADSGVFGGLTWDERQARSGVAA